MTKLIIDNLYPNNIIKFVLQGEVYDEISLSPSLEIKIPPAVPLMSKVDIELAKETAPPTYSDKGFKEFPFRAFSKQPYRKSGYYKLRVLLTVGKDRSSLKSGDTAKIVSDSSDLTNVNNKTVTVLESKLSSTGRTWVLDLEVENSFPITEDFGSVDSDSSYIQEVRVKRTRNAFTIKIPKERVFDNLINAKRPATGIATVAVRDIPIYAYKTFDKENSSKIPRRLLLDNSLIDEKKPPTYSNDIRDAYLVGPSYTKILPSDENPNFLFYVAIARYTYRNEKWSGEWLQRNKSNKVIWGKAILGGNK